jgi:hypothetical protein
MGQVHSQQWYLLTDKQMADLFHANFKSVTILPNIALIHRLKVLRSATLECLENRTCSTVYRIRQTGMVYQICQSGDDPGLFEYDSFESYQANNPIDELIEAFISKDLVHIIRETEGVLYIERLKFPRFRAKYVPGRDNLQSIEWIDEQPINNKTFSLFRKAEAFISNYFKNI